MHAGRIARIIGQAAAASLLGLGVSVLGGQAAQADDYTWETGPAPVAPTTDDDYTWEIVGDGIATFDYTWE